MVRYWTLHIFPSSHHCEEGWRRHQENGAKPLIDAAEVVFLVPSIGTPPRPREKRMLRDIFLIARPPLIVPKMKVCSMLINSSPACGKCGKAERLSEAFPSSCGNPHQGEAAEGNRFFRGFPKLRHFPQAVFFFFFGSFFFC